MSVKIIPNLFNTNIVPFDVVGVYGLATTFPSASFGPLTIINEAGVSPCGLNCIRYMRHA
jgi:hypothetical protein